MKKRVLLAGAISFLFLGCAPQPEVVTLDSFDSSDTSTLFVEESKQQPQSDLKPSSLVVALNNHYQAAQHGDSEEYKRTRQEVEKILAKGVSDIDALDSNNQNALIVAAGANDYEMVSRVVDAGANPNVKTAQNIPLLTATLQEGNLESAKALIAKGADTNAQSSNAPTPLAVTVLGGVTSKQYQEMSMLLLDKGANPNNGKIADHSLLLYAIKTSQDAIATKMIAKGVDIEQSDENGLTPLSWAIILNQSSTIDALIDQKANADARDVYGYSPLAWAVFVDNQKAKERMIQSGFSVNENDRGWMAAEIAKTKTLNELRVLFQNRHPSMDASEDHSIIRFRDMNFLYISHKPNEITFHTQDEHIESFMLSKPDRLVVDFKRHGGAKNISVPIKDSQFKKVTVGRHAGKYRVVIELDKRYQYSLSKADNKLIVTLK